MKNINDHIDKIEDGNSEFPISRNMVIDGLLAEGRTVKEGDPYNELLDRLGDEGMMEIIKHMADNRKWKRTEYGNQVFHYLTKIKYNE